MTFQISFTNVDLKAGMAAKIEGSNGNVAFIQAGQQAILNAHDGVSFTVTEINAKDVPVLVPNQNEPDADAETVVSENDQVDTGSPSDEEDVLEDFPTGGNMARDAADV